jgi:hypothetical protein
LEDADDRELARMLRERLAAGPQASDALRWRDMVDEWGR